MRERLTPGEAGNQVRASTTTASPRRTADPEKLTAAASSNLGHSFALCHSFARVSVLPPTQVVGDAPPVATDWIVEDDVPAGPGQMHRGAFVAAVGAEVHTTADRALARAACTSVA